MSLGIKTYCLIRKNKIYLDGVCIFANDEATDLKSFLVKAFKDQKLKYPKFYKMDDISKLGFLAAELLVKNASSDYTNEDVSIVLSNSQSTLVTDSNFQKSIEDDDNFYPSPAVFVYTLPNIMIGEISIRHKLRGENAFFIFDRFNAKAIADYINRLFDGGKTTYAIGGWVDQSEEVYEAFLYCADPFIGKDVAIEHNAEELSQLYSKK
jgi:hypothetical protein